MSSTGHSAISRYKHIHNLVSLGDIIFSGQAFSWIRVKGQNIVFNDLHVLSVVSRYIVRCLTYIPGLGSVDITVYTEGMLQTNSFFDRGQCQNVGRGDLLSVRNTLPPQDVSSYWDWCLQALQHRSYALDQHYI